jgi:cell division protein FtsI (penicillin-binding protein 3)/stage V sporulation protein D (sporulation-specific penicillin-binding protein)
VNRTAKTRALTTCLLLAGCYTAFSFRLVHLQVTQHDEYAACAAEKHVKRQTIYARRAAIQDIHGESLAQNEPVRTVVADATLIKDRGELADVLAVTLGLPKAQLMEKLGREVFSQSQKKNVPAPYIVLKKEVPESVASDLGDELSERKLRGIFFEQDTTRVYPNGHMLCHVLGFVNGENLGVEGVERTMEQFLRGHDGFRYTERDRTGREIVPYRGQEKEARNGCNVRLTIDMGLQNIVEQELDAAIKQFRPKGATVILMHPKTGEILALANRPNFNLNEQDKVAPDQRRNRAIADMVEPGSTFKIVTTAAALTERIVRPTTMINCENGYFASAKLHDHHPYSDLSVNDTLVKSSNIGMAKLAIQLGDQKFYEYIRRFGFGERTGVNLPGEISGVIHPPHLWSKISITRMPMGQEVGATPLQITAAMCAIANGGNLMMPQIIHEIVDDQGRAVSQFPPQVVRRVASKEATEAIRSALVEVVSPKGTASLARVAGFKVAGKTGTAQKYDEKTRLPSHEKYVVSFLGYMPADDPAFVALVMLDEAQAKPGQNYGGLVAAPIFSRIGEKAARYLGLVPSPEEAVGTIVAGQNFRDQ